LKKEDEKRDEMNKQLRDRVTKMETEVEVYKLAQEIQNLNIGEF